MLFSRKYCIVNPSILISLLFVLLGLVSLVLWRTARRKIKELESKTAFATQGESMMKVTFEGDRDLEQISDHFNALVHKYLKARESNQELSETSKEKEALDVKFHEIETSMSQITSMTTIGRKITGSLDVQEILQTMAHYIFSSMEADDIELLYYSGDDSILLRIDQQQNLERILNPKERLDVMRWAIDNEKEVFLNKAAEDYEQFVFDPIVSVAGYGPEALLCIPLMLHNKSFGALCVLSKRAEVYNSYHLEFIQTLGSFLSVALDNSRIYKLLEEGKEVIEQEKHKSDELLLNILPDQIAQELKDKGEAAARRYDEVSILFTDFKEFTQRSMSLDPEELIELVNHFFKAFDQICEKYNIEKIKTIGDSYMAAGGLPVPSDESIRNTVMAALEMAEFVEKEGLKAKVGDRIPFQMRVGINTGRVVAGIVGLKKFQYDIWGDAVNTASRMESNGEVGRVNISSSTYQKIKDDPDFVFEHRGKIKAKGKGEVDMYFVSRA